MAYRAEIEIGIKGAARLKDLQNRLKNLATLIDENNKKPLFDRVAVQSVNQYADALSTAKRNLDQVQIELNAAGKATGNYSKSIKEFVTALGAANQAQEITNNLIDQEISARTQATAALKAYNAAAAAPTQRGAATTMSGGYLRGAFRGGSQYPGPIGPGAASSTALSSALPARSARTTQYLSPIGPISPQERTGRAEQLAREAALKSQANQKEFAAQKAFQTKLFNIEKQFENSLIRQRVEADNAEFDRLLKRLDAEKRKRNEINTLTEKFNKKQLEDFDRRLREAGNLRGQTSPIGGAVGIPGSPAAKQRTARNKKLQGAASNAIIGGAFPLLFGQGVGASVGGAAGGALGGLAGGQFGFGLSLVGTAVGTAVDTLIAETGELAKALNSTGGAFDLLTEKSLFSSKETELLANQLAELGEVEKLATLVTEELVGIIGNKGVESLQTLGDTTDETTRLWGALTLQLQKLVAGPLNAFLSLINRALGAQVQLGQFKSIIEDNPAAKARYQELIGARRGRDAAKNGMSQAEARAQVLKEFPPVVTAEIPVTAGDRKRFTPPKTKVDRGAERAALEEQRLQERLAFLRVELNLIAANADFKQKITAAEIAGNKELAIRLKAQQTINTIQASEEKALIRIENIREINLEKQKTAAKINAANVNAAAELAVFEDQKQKAFNEQIENLNFQYEILTATTVEEQKQLKIAQQMAALKGKDFTPEQLKEIKAAKEKLDIGLIQTYVNELQRSLSDTESMVVSLAQSVESSLATAMSSAVQSIVTGTGSVQEAFSDMFANIGKAFVDMATQMIAKALIMKALGILTSAFGGGGGGGFNPGAPSITGNSLGNFGGGTPFAGAFRANGGPVSANQPYIVGERGPELLIPQTSGTVLSNEDSRAALARYKPGNSLLSEAGGDSTGTGVGRSQTLDPVINISTGPTLQFEGERYVKQEDFRAGLARAAQEGARQGQTLTLRKLMMSPTARSKIGI